MKTIRTIQPSAFSMLHLSCEKQLRQDSCRRSRTGLVSDRGYPSLRGSCPQRFPGHSGVCPRPDGVDSRLIFSSPSTSPAPSFSLPPACFKLPSVGSLPTGALLGSRPFALFSFSSFRVINQRTKGENVSKQPFSQDEDLCRLRNRLAGNVGFVGHRGSRRQLHAAHCHPAAHAHRAPAAAPAGTVAAVTAPFAGTRAGGTPGTLHRDGNREVRRDRFKRHRVSNIVAQ